MTDMRMALAELLEKGSDADLMREMVGFVAQRMMDLDVEGLCGAIRHAGEHRETSSELYRSRLSAHGVEIVRKPIACETTLDIDHILSSL